ncbi:MAG: hypothetical protein HUU55_17515 [Myxococcales bacterium]|nr:hypothetical protein [Myxococcales bacterium]
MEILTLIGIGYIGAIFWIISTEVAAVYYCVELGWNPVLVAITCAIGQCGMYATLFSSGGLLLRKWTRFQVLVEKTARRFGTHHRIRYLSIAGFGSVTGIPPMPALAVLAPGFHVPLVGILAVAFVFRSVRFFVLAQFGNVLIPWLIRVTGLG